MQVPLLQSKSPLVALNDPDAAEWLRQQIERTALDSPTLVDNFDATHSALLNMAKDFERAFASATPKPSTASYLYSFANELLGNFFVNSNSSFSDLQQKMDLARLAARIYLDGQQDPAVFIGYPILKILVTKTVVEATEWIEVMRKNADQLRAIPASRFNWLIDDASSAAELTKLIDSYRPRPDRVI